MADTRSSQARLLPLRPMTIPFRPVARSASGSTSGEKADMARRTGRSRRARRPARACPPEPPRRGITVREDKGFPRILIFPPATEPADGRARPDSQGILVFPFRTTPRRGRRDCRGRRDRRGRPRTRREHRRPCIRRAPPGALPAVHQPGAPFAAHRRLCEGDGHAAPYPARRLQPTGMLAARWMRLLPRPPYRARRFQPTGPLDVPPTAPVKRTLDVKGPDRLWAGQAAGSAPAHSRPEPGGPSRSTRR